MCVESEFLVRQQLGGVKDLPRVLGEVFGSFEDGLQHRHFAVLHSDSFGQAFFTTSAELGLRVSQQLYLSSFFDAGNIWLRARDFNPTRLFRGAGFGGALVTPLGPLGLDMAYGFDRVNELGQPAPKWQVHFKFGQFF